jgi:molybdopterin-binding protein
MTPFIKATLGLTFLSPADKVIKGQSIKDSMQTSGNFPAAGMPITYPSLQTIITNFHNSIIAATNGTPTDTAAMHEHERIFVSAFNFIRSHVEFVANGNSANAASIITSAGMQVAGIGGNNAVSELTLEASGNGKIKIRIPRQTGEKAFIFESSADNITWGEVLFSSNTTVTLSNQTPVTTLYIRYSAISKTGKGAYSQAKTVVVL